MPEASIQRSNTVPQWPRYLMLCGLVCIIFGIVGLSIAQKHPLIAQASNSVGYFGLFLVLSGFFIHISLDWP